MPINKQTHENTSRRKSLIICAICAACFLAFIVCLQIFSHASKPFMGLGSADPGYTTAIMIILGPALAIWGFSVRQRCPDRFIGKRLVIIVGLLVFWLALVIVKYPSSNDTFIITCWYMYYIPMLLIPALLFACSLRAATYENTQVGKALRAFVLFASVCLILLVLTNSAHMCVFSFSIKNTKWDGIYSYEFGYWTILIWLILIYIASFILLFVAARKNLKPAFLPLLICAIVALAYCILYILRVEFLFKTNFSLTCVVLLVLAIEIILDTGIFPSSWYYKEIFNSLPFKIALVSKTGEVSQSTLNLDSENLKLIEEKASHSLGNNATQTITSQDKNTLVRNIPIKGGTAVLLIDIETLNRRKKLKIARNEQLAASNLILQNTIKTKAQLAQTQREEEILRAIDVSLKEKLEEIDQILQNLPDANSPENQIIRKSMLERVKFLTAYCKRKASLVISEVESTTFNHEQVALIFTESSSDFRSLGIECAVFVKELRSVPPAIMEKLYDVVYNSIESAAKQNAKIVLISICDAEDNNIEIRISFSEEDVSKITIARNKL